MWKYYRGQILVSVSKEVPIFQSIEEFDSYSQFTDNVTEGKFVFAKSENDINDGKHEHISSELSGAFRELKQRDDKYAKYFVRYRETQYQNCKIPTKIHNTELR